MEILNKALFGASLLLATLGMSIQAKAATYDISAVGSAQITSITDTSGTVTYNESTATGSNGIYVIMNFSFNITDMSSIQPGDVIRIPISVTAGSHFQVPGLSFSSDVKSGGQTVFTVSFAGGVITLTATNAVQGMSGSLVGELSGTSFLTIFANNSSTWTATSTTFTVNDNAYTFKSAPYVLNPITYNSIQLYNMISQQNSATDVMALSLYGLYQRYFLQGQTINPTDPALNQNIVAVTTIAASPNVVNVAFSSAPSHSITYVASDTAMSGMSGMSAGSSSPVSSYTTVSLSPDLSMSAIEAALQPGQRAIVKNSDGTWTIAVNYGPILNNPFLEYPANFTSPDSPSNAVLQQAIAANFAAVATPMSYQVTFSDPTVQESVQATIANNMPSVLGISGSPTTLTDIPVNNAAAGQTLIKIHYVDLSGNNIAVVNATYGWPADNTMNQQPTPAVQITDSVIAGYTQVINAAIYDTMTSIPTAQILYSDTSINYPLTAVGTAEYYYVYAPIATQDLPITGLQLNAQVQGNNDVLLTWGTITEINSKSFTVQRSADNGKTWVNVGSLPTQAQNGNSSVPLTYQLSDQYVPVGSYEYRVVETDINGSTTTSNVVPIQITAGAKVYPIPASTYIRIILPAGTNNVSYRMISTDGKVVLQGSMSNQGNFGQISVAGLASAVYFLQVTINNAVQTYKVQVQH